MSSTPATIQRWSITPSNAHNANVAEISHLKYANGTATCAVPLANCSRHVLTRALSSKSLRLDFLCRLASGRGWRGGGRSVSRRIDVEVEHQNAEAKHSGNASRDEHVEPHRFFGSQRLRFEFFRQSRLLIIVLIDRDAPSLSTPKLLNVHAGKAGSRDEIRMCLRRYYWAATEPGGPGFAPSPPVVSKRLLASAWKLAAGLRRLLAVCLKPGIDQCNLRIDRRVA